MLMFKNSFRRNALSTQFTPDHDVHPFTKFLGLLRGGKRFNGILTINYCCVNFLNGSLQAWPKYLQITFTCMVTNRQSRLTIFAYILFGISLLSSFYK